MKKIIAILLSILLLATFMTGCSAWDEFSEGFKAGLTEGQEEVDEETSNTNKKPENEGNGDNPLKNDMNAEAKEYSLTGYSGNKNVFCNLSMLTSFGVDINDKEDSILVYENEGSNYANIYLEEKPATFDNGDGIAVAYGEYYGDPSNSQKKWNCHKITYYEENKPQYLLYAESTLDNEDICIIISSTSFEFAKQVASTITIDAWTSVRVNK